MSDPYHPLNDDTAADEEPAEKADIIQTPGRYRPREDLPPAPPLPDDHPLNANPGYPLTLIENRPGTLQVFYLDQGDAITNSSQCISVCSFRIPVDVLTGNALQVGENGSLYITRIAMEATSPGETGMAYVYFNIPEDDALWTSELQVRIVDGRIIVEPQAAIPGSFHTFQISDSIEDDGRHGHVTVFDSPTPDGRVFGFFFTPPLKQLPADWRQRAEGWALWSWGRHRSTLRMETGDARPGDIVRALLNNRGRDLVLTGTVQELPDLPPWLGHHPDVTLTRI